MVKKGVGRHGRLLSDVKMPLFPLFFLFLAGAQAAQAQCVSLIINTCTFILRNLKWP